MIVRAGVNAANVDKAVASIDTEVSTLANDGVTGDELDNSKRYLTGSLPRTLETNTGVAAFPPERSAVRSGAGLRPPLANPDWWCDPRRGTRRGAADARPTPCGVGGGRPL